MKFSLIITSILFITNTGFSQSIHTYIPRTIDKAGRYMFYLHGKIIEEQGVHATHPQLGKYEYLGILDSLNKNGFNVISEVRPKDTDEKVYANKVNAQLDSLLKAGVPAKNIFVLGASKGAYIALWVSAKAKNKDLNFIIMGTCSDETTVDLNGYELCGRFLSIFESSDSFATSCVKMLSNKKCVKTFNEIKLTLNIGHAFLYKPYREWMDPMIKWAGK
ncbi:MAG TPA: hypothetical protein VF691_02200 [Cytophagaceae bacterium]|jgi:hypothetical protein